MDVKCELALHMQEIKKLNILTEIFISNRKRKKNERTKRKRKKEIRESINASKTWKNYPSSKKYN